MKATTSTKYSYWKWVLLNKHCELLSSTTKRNLIAIYNPTEEKIFRYDTDTKKKIKTNWSGLDWLFENYLSKLLTIGELADFFKSLPPRKQKMFWDCIGRT